MQIWRRRQRERQPFVKIDVPAGSFWLNEKSVWYDFTNWGRKNGMSALHGVAVDAEDRVYVCDRANQRLAGWWLTSGPSLGSRTMGG